MPKTYAFWIQLEPWQQMRGEGIGEHLMRLLKGMHALGGSRAIVCAPRWAEGVMRDMLEAHGVPADFAELRLFGPPLIRFRLPRRAPAQDGAAPAGEPTAPPPMAGARRLVEVPGWRILAALGLIAAPFILLPWVLARNIARWMRPRLAALRHRLWKIVEGLTYAEMARFIDAHPDIAGCFVPIGNWEYCRFIETKKLAVQIPDVVFLEFPEHFADSRGEAVLVERIKYVARRADAVICASEFVKASHLVKGLGVEPAKVHVVDHAPMRVDQELAAACARKALPVSKASALEICKEFQATALAGAAYVARLGGSDYWLSKARDPEIWRRPKLYCPTQYRPYKNIEHLIGAVARLRDHHEHEVTLFVTADLTGAARVRELVASLDLQGHVIPLPRVPHDIHAAFYAAADLAIAPSSFEGGFPFIFSEAASVGTPVIMARIPVTLAKIKGPMLERMTFAPADAEDLATRIHEALRDSVLAARQQALYRDVFGERSWRDVAAGYLAALEGGAAPAETVACPEDAAARSAG